MFKTQRLFSWQSIAALFAVVVLVTAAGATAAEKAPPIETLRSARASLAAQIAELTSKSEKEGDAEKDAKVTEKDQETLAALRALDAIYVQHQNRLEDQKKFESQLQDAEKELKSLEKYEPNEPKPYSFLFWDGLKDQLAVEEDRQHAIEADLKSAKQLLESAHEELNELKGDHVRPIEKKREPDKEKDSVREKESMAGVLALEATGQAARAKVALKQTDVELQSLRLKLCENQQEQLKKKIEVVEKDVAFTKRDRDAQLERFVKAEAELKRQEKKTEVRLDQIEADEQQELKSLSDKSAANETVDAAKNSWRIVSDALQAQVVLLDQQIEHIGSLRRFWKRRYELGQGGVGLEKLTEWKDDLDEFIDQLADNSRSLEHRRDSLRDQQSLLTQARREGETDETAKWREIQTARLQELGDLYETSLADVKSTERSLDRFRGELKDKIKAAEAAGGGLVQSWGKLVDYKILSNDDGSVTVGALLILLPAIVVAVVLAFLLSKLVGGHVLSRMGIHRGAAAAIRSILFYSLCVMFAVIAFQLLNIPLASFAFLGGAAAIAVGFGSQDIMNNFMSGIILLSEQPIRVEDVIEIGDVQGVVLHIGLRSTRLRTDANYELIVPNKTLLDEQVTNLTLSDNFVQKSITFTLERTIPVQRAKEVMARVAFSHPLVLKSPRPMVLIKEVDTYYNTITFAVYFSVQLYSFMKCAKVQSDILEEINERLQKKDEPAEEEKKPAEEVTEAAKDGSEQTAQPSDAATANGSPVAIDDATRGMILKEVRRAMRIAAK